MKIHTLRSDSAGNNSQASNRPLTTIMIHGLDSSSKTWPKIMDKLSTPCVALDQRGCGESELGDPAEFSQEILVDDIHNVVVQEKLVVEEPRSSSSSKLIVLRHSLGGRVALAYAATYPENVAALIMEDMDIIPRPVAEAPFQVLADTDDIFDRRADSVEAATAKLKQAGYPESRIDRWVAEGRIEQLDDGSWWSHVNPMFRKLCYEHVLSSCKGRVNCHTIANSDDMTFPVHVLVAGSEGTVCKDESIEEMKEILGDQLTIHRYPTAGHSIHSSATEEFLATVESIILNAS